MPCPDVQRAASRLLVRSKAPSPPHGCRSRSPASLSDLFHRACASSIVDFSNHARLRALCEAVNQAGPQARRLRSRACFIDLYWAMPRSEPSPSPGCAIRRVEGFENESKLQRPGKAVGCPPPCHNHRHTRRRSSLRWSRSSPGPASLPSPPSRRRIVAVAGQSALSMPAGGPPLERSVMTVTAGLKSRGHSHTACVRPTLCRRPSKGRACELTACEASDRLRG